MKIRRPAVPPIPPNCAADASPRGAAHDPLDWPAGSGAVEEVLDEMNRRLAARRRRRLVAGAGVAALGLCGLALWWTPLAPSVLAVREPVAASVLVLAPERRLLPDGSVVELRAGAQLEMSFSPEQRRVVLREGEAHFQVTKDPARPFVVSAGGVDFRAVGTAFAVTLHARKVEMVVTEGRVAVDRRKEGPGEIEKATVAPGALGREKDADGDVPTALHPALPAGGTSVFVEAGSQVVVEIDTPPTSAPSVSPLAGPEISRRLAWRAPKLEFSSTPLAEAVALINRHATDPRAHRLRLGDPALAGIRLTGILRADNIDTLIGVLEADYGIRVERRGDSEIVLLRAK